VRMPLVPSSDLYHDDSPAPTAPHSQGKAEKALYFKMHPSLVWHIWGFGANGEDPV
jgi:hypothetical protein